jgi:hypothetical protein
MIVTKQLSKRITTTRNDNEYKEIVELSKDEIDKKVIYRFEIHIRRNTYDFQSFAVIHTWNGTAWNRVADIPYPHMHTPGFRSEGLKEEDFLMDAEDLLDHASLVVFGKGLYT